MTPLMQVKSLRKTFPLSKGFFRKVYDQFVAVSDVSFDLYQGEVLGIVGESGSGKSTTALMLLKLLDYLPTHELSGNIYFEEKNLLTLSERQMRSIRGAKLAMIFQDPAAALNPVFTVGEQVAEMWRLHRRSSLDEAKERAVSSLEKVGLQKMHNFFETYPHQISGGMKQRVMIAMALMAFPKILIADEPTTALDLTVQKEILQLLKECQQETDMALLLITHDMGVVAEMADEVAVMYAAEIVEFGSVNEIFENPLHPYTQALFRARPTRADRKKPLQVISGIPPQGSKRPTGCPFHPRCPFAMPKCKEGPVATFYDKKHKNHFAKCWLLEEE